MHSGRDIFKKKADGYVERGTDKYMIRTLRGYLVDVNLLAFEEAEAYFVLYVEDLSDARTKLEGPFM